MKSLYVVVSINMDIVNELRSFPQPGETVESQRTSYHPGGKGANQAVAAAKAVLPSEW
ncbi:PfkB family carbohydrate kinase [Paenibacillus sp. PFR10]|uniref:PfkB family carbohydrate kinase n=1 Tax=Paenibacillus violae TaxID=3077234 RepID=A0ABU3RQH7_9BACL|nr:PfkB family carbohydrate kinase [Paenibacillus sp. PFR10]MDU0206356.1 PfkB family carbohydrate kinase [Paenibacillus sp. PFR10]